MGTLSMMMTGLAVAFWGGVAWLAMGETKAGAILMAVSLGLLVVFSIISAEASRL